MSSKRRKRQASRSAHTAEPQPHSASKEGRAEHASAKAVSPTPAGTEFNDSVAALAALYQGEKTDAAYVFNTAMAMMGIAVTYLVGAIASLDKFGKDATGALSLLLLPMPLWLIAAYHSLMTLNAMSHGISVQIIEDALFTASAVRSERDRDLVGSRAGDKIMDIGESRFPHTLATYVVYGGVGLSIVGFTVYVLLAANRVPNTNVAMVRARVIWIAGAMYLLLAVVVASSWTVGLGMIKEARERAGLKRNPRSRGWLLRWFERMRGMMRRRRQRKQHA